ncbi:porin [Pendulispora albinea]|uniref:OprO/OprP family phosphate-selective porin n=1 Tax=Pendulispora albinea TaxID=2741071 RepID=A0ABZ2LJH7_9BACT
MTAQKGEIKEQRERIEKLEAELKKLAAPPPPPPPPPAEKVVDFGMQADPTKQIVVRGYVQGEYRADKSSEDEVGQGGRLLNADRFLIRRGRLLVEREWEWASALLELDGNTTNGPTMGIQRAEASLLYRGGNAHPKPPLLAFTIGQFRSPYSAENLQSPQVRYFMERSTMSQAMFPSEIDLGARLSGALGWFRYQLAFTNGQPLGVRDYPLQDPTSAKELSFRVEAVTQPLDKLQVNVGFSGLTGRGFHREGEGTKGQLIWNDQNGDGIFQPSEITAINPVAARPSSTFKRFALTVDGQVRYRTPIGWAELSGAVYAASNMDRGLYVADPVLLGRDVRHFGYVVSLTQEIADWFVVGFRTDMYNPDSDSSDFQGAKRVQPFDMKIQTYSPLAGITFRKRGRLLFQYDFVRDHLGRDQAGLPVDLNNDRMTLRLQVDL